MTKRIPATVEVVPSHYESEAKVYPRSISGRYQNLRKIAVFWLLGMYYVFPWLSWDGRQAVLFDLPARKFYVFWLNFWPQDFIYLAVLLIIAGLSLFFFTALAGRLWCGYACPQTVWTEVFLWVEQWTEGDRAQRMRLDAGPWNARKWLRKGSKHVLWLVLALWTGFTFVGFFTPIRDLAAGLMPFSWGGWEIFWVLFYSLATWGNAGILREQVCKYMCPYARFQGAMFDRNTLIISYDPMRGEPRGPRKRSLGSVLERARGLLPLQKATASVIANASVQRSSSVVARATTGLADTISAVQREAAPEVSSQEDLGDCIDCTICVQVCPTGIDIRNGLQYECIACAACIDACDEVMDKMGYPRGLIRHTTQNAIDGETSTILRPRILIYGALLSALIAAWGWGITHRTPLIVDVLRDRNALYREMADGTVENVYTLKLVNKSPNDIEINIAVSGQPAIRFTRNPSPLRIEAESLREESITLQADRSAVSGRLPIQFDVSSEGDNPVTIQHDSAFFAPQ